MVCLAWCRIQTGLQQCQMFFQMYLCHLKLLFQMRRLCSLCSIQTENGVNKKVKSFCSWLYKTNRFAYVFKSWCHAITLRQAQGDKDSNYIKDPCQVELAETYHTIYIQPFLKKVKAFATDIIKKIVLLMYSNLSRV